MLVRSHPLKTSSTEDGISPFFRPFGVSSTYGARVFSFAASFAFFSFAFEAAAGVAVLASL
jgi:hypothetical protein